MTQRIEKSTSTSAPAPDVPPPDDYRWLRQKLVQAVQRFCPSWLASQRDDIVQSAMIRILEIREKGDGTKVLDSFYIRKVAHSVTVDEIRRAGRRRETLLAEADPAEMMQINELTPERQTAGREIGDAIRNCLTRLVRPRRLALGLFLLGHSVSECSQQLGWSYTRVENLVYRGLADLRRCLTSKGVTP